MKTIIGVREFKGVYQDKPYCNYRVYYQLDDVPESRGTCTDFWKVSKKLADQLVLDNNLNDIFDLVGLVVTDVYYDVYKNPAKFVFL